MAALFLSAAVPSARMEQELAAVDAILQSTPTDKDILDRIAHLTGVDSTGAVQPQQSAVLDTQQQITPDIQQQFMVANSHKRNGAVVNQQQQPVADHHSHSDKSTTEVPAATYSELGVGVDGHHVDGSGEDSPVPLAADSLEQAMLQSTQTEPGSITALLGDCLAPLSPSTGQQAILGDTSTPPQTSTLANGTAVAEDVCAPANASQLPVSGGSDDAAPVQQLQQLAAAILAAASCCSQHQQLSQQNPQQPVGHQEQSHPALGMQHAHGSGSTVQAPNDDVHALNAACISRASASNGSDMDVEQVSEPGDSGAVPPLPPDNDQSLGDPPLPHATVSSALAGLSPADDNLAPPPLPPPISREDHHGIPSAPAPQPPPPPPPPPPGQSLWHPGASQTQQQVTCSQDGAGSVFAAIDQQHLPPHLRGGRAVAIKHEQDLPPHLRGRAAAPAMHSSTPTDKGVNTAIAAVTGDKGGTVLQNKHSAPNPQQHVKTVHMQQQNEVVITQQQQQSVVQHSQSAAATNGAAARHGQFGRGVDEQHMDQTQPQTHQECAAHGLQLPAVASTSSDPFAAAAASSADSKLDADFASTERTAYDSVQEFLCIAFGSNPAAVGDAAVQDDATIQHAPAAPDITQPSSANPCFSTGAHSADQPSADPAAANVYDPDDAGLLVGLEAVGFSPAAANVQSSVPQPDASHSQTRVCTNQVQPATGQPQLSSRDVRRQQKKPKQPLQWCPPPLPVDQIKPMTDGAPYTLETSPLDRALSDKLIPFRQAQEAAKEALTPVKQAVSSQTQALTPLMMSRQRQPPGIHDRLQDTEEDEAVELVLKILTLRVGQVSVSRSSLWHRIASTRPHVFIVPADSKGCEIMLNPNTQEVCNWLLKTRKVCSLIQEWKARLREQCEVKSARNETFQIGGAHSLMSDQLKTLKQVSGGRQSGNCVVLRKMSSHLWLCCMCL